MPNFHPANVKLVLLEQSVQSVFSLARFEFSGFFPFDKSENSCLNAQQHLKKIMMEVDLNSINLFTCLLTRQVGLFEGTLSVS